MSVSPLLMFKHSRLPSSRFPRIILKFFLCNVTFLEKIQARNLNLINKKKLLIVSPEGMQGVRAKVGSINKTVIITS